MKAIASHNGLAATGRAYDLLTGGLPALQAVVEGVTLLEDDPDELTVGYGGLPNEQGIVELDASVMDGLTHRCAAVAGLQNVRHASRLALRLLEQTRRVLVCGAGALEFARQQGFIEENLLTDRARRMWLHWKRSREKCENWLPPDESDAAELDLQTWLAQHFYGRGGGTVHCAALDGRGHLGCATSTSGHAFKMPGRIGDTPVPGAGFYADNHAGSAGCIGHGEASLQNCSSFFAVEQMRQGASPREAGRAALQRVAQHAPVFDCDELGRPRYDLQMFLLARDGSHAGISLWNDRFMAVTDASGSRREPCEALFQR